MADMKLGANLYAQYDGKYYQLNNGSKSFVASPFETQTSKLNSIYDAQQKNQLDLLKNQRNKAIAGYNQQKKELKPQFQAQRNQADVVNAQNVSKLRELMAANGINASGENVTASAGLASARQTALSDITNNEQTAYRDIDRQIADVNDPAQEQAIINAIQTERSKALADAYQAWQQQAYAQMMDWRNYEMQQQQLAASRARSSGGRRSSGGGSGGGSSSSSRSVPNANQANANQSVLDQYYSNPIIKQVEDMKKRTATNNILNRLFDEPVSIADNPNLSAWEKMKLFEYQ